MFPNVVYRRPQAGFTLVELLIVIVVIAILAAIVINTFSGVQARARDTERQTDVKAVSAQLEVYYTNNGGYLNGGQMTGTVASITTLLQGLGGDALKNPQAPSGTTNSFVTGATALAVTNYKYNPLQSDGTTACTATGTATCAKFTMQWIKEQDSSTITVTSLN